MPSPPSGSFSTISGPSGGSQSGGYKGFAIINDNGEAIYDQAYPDDHSPCYNTDGGRTFTIEGDSSPPPPRTTSLAGPTSAFSHFASISWQAA